MLTLLVASLVWVQVLNQVVIWDQIISEPQHAWIRSSSVANKCASSPHAPPPRAAPTAMCASSERVASVRAGTR